MDSIIKNEKGSAILELLFALPVLVFILFTAVQYWGIFTIHQRTEDLKFRALESMEIYGGLTEYDEEQLIDDLIKLGADPNTIVITGDLLRYQDELPWPNELYLRIEFIPKHFNNFTARVLLGRSPGEPLRVGVDGSVISNVQTY